MFQITIEPDQVGVRVDRLVRKILKNKPLSSIYRLIRTGEITINNKKITQEYRLQLSDVLSIMHYDQEPTGTTARIDTLKRLYSSASFRNNFQILYEDESLLVCNKPAGLVVHGGTGHTRNDTLIDLAASYLFNSHQSIDFTEPILVHRIDKETSGVILLAKNKQILRQLHEALRGREIQKKYRALCHGIPPQRKGTIEINLTKSSSESRGMKMRTGEQGMYAKSSYEVMRQKKDFSELLIQLHTGRTHQIRVHCSHIHCPIIGDDRYGDAQKDEQVFTQKKITSRLFLHAETISFFHPLLKRHTSFSACLPQEFDILMS